MILIAWHILSIIHDVSSTTIGLQHKHANIVYDYDQVNDADADVDVIGHLVVCLKLVDE